MKRLAIIATALMALVNSAQAEPKINNAHDRPPAAASNRPLSDFMPTINPPSLRVEDTYPAGYQPTPTQEFFARNGAAAFNVTKSSVTKRNQH